jgi:hypothetical protein
MDEFMTCLLEGLDGFEEILFSEEDIICIEG